MAKNRLDWIKENNWIWEEYKQVCRELDEVGRKYSDLPKGKEKWDTGDKFVELFNKANEIFCHIDPEYLMGGELTDAFYKEQAGRKN